MKFRTLDDLGVLQRRAFSWRENRHNEDSDLSQEKLLLFGFSALLTCLRSPFFDANYSPPAKTNLVRFPVGSPRFLRVGNVTSPLADESSREICYCSIFAYFTFTEAQCLAYQTLVKLLTHSDLTNVHAEEAIIHAKEWHGLMEAVNKGSNSRLRLGQVARQPPGVPTASSWLATPSASVRPTGPRQTSEAITTSILCLGPRSLSNLDCFTPTKANKFDPGRVTPYFRKWESFRAMPLFLPCIPALLHSNLISPSSALKSSFLRAAQFSQLNSTILSLSIGHSRHAFIVAYRKPIYAVYQINGGGSCMFTGISEHRKLRYARIVMLTRRRQQRRVQNFCQGRREAKAHIALRLRSHLCAVLRASRVQLGLQQPVTSVHQALLIWDSNSEPRVSLCVCTRRRDILEVEVRRGFRKVVRNREWTKVNIDHKRSRGSIPVLSKPDKLLAKWCLSYCWQMSIYPAQLGSPLVDDRPIMNAVKYRTVFGVVWNNRTMVSSNTDTNRTAAAACSGGETAALREAPIAIINLAHVYHMQMSSGSDFEAIYASNIKSVSPALSSAPLLRSGSVRRSMAMFTLGYGQLNNITGIATGTPDKHDITGSCPDLSSTRRNEWLGSRFFLARPFSTFYRRPFLQPPSLSPADSFAQPRILSLLTPRLRVSLGSPVSTRSTGYHAYELLSARRHLHEYTGLALTLYLISQEAVGTNSEPTAALHSVHTTIQLNDDWVRIHERKRYTI
ncbi:hypothetical protein PR048_006088 [Dryococelus australis]|uniref:Uncharacterized protein n=1 Tax=Dryococelus australis TaxID=614101 RepID=A0ABQ9I9Z7_9NEOP|nr:hypothetical protein PR048_006088 [Dryococelus australis]